MLIDIATKHYIIVLNYIVLLQSNKRKKKKMNVRTVKQIRDARTSRQASVYASYDFFEEVKENLKVFSDNQKVLPLAVTDYGGDFWDYAVILYCIENDVKNFWYEHTIYNGYNAFLVVSDEQLEEAENYILAIFDDFEDFFFHLEYTIIEDEIDRLFAESPALRFYSREVMYDALSNYGQVVNCGTLDYDFDTIIRECKRTKK